MASSESKKSPEELIAAVPTPTAEGKIWHEAACHCHAVEYKILFPPLYPPYATSGANTVPWWEHPSQRDPEREEGKAEPPLVMACNCSICMKNGYTLIYPQRADVVFTKGWDSLRDYRFATRMRDHKFCGECGSSLMIDFKGNFPVAGDILGINARMIKDFDFDKVVKRRGNGRENISPQFNEQYS